MNYEPNTTTWSPGDIVIHDYDAKTSDMSYASLLGNLKLFGDIKDWRFEKVNLKLADKTYYKPDFVVIHNDNGLEFVEVKGKWEDDARVKIKVAAELFPFWKFTAAFGLKKGVWQYERWNQ